MSRQVNITLNIRRGFAWQIGNSEWSPEKRAAIFHRFWDRVKRGEAKDCWRWTGYITSRGYGEFCCEGQRVRAHRFAWWAARGPIPAGTEVCHSCDNTACVNPSHLFLGSHLDNHLDSVCKGRKRVFGRQKLNAAQVQTIRALAARGVRQADIAARFGIARHSVSGIVHRKSWAHVA